ncbi:MAG: M23 family metallopeptidase [Propionibacteriaceae bacterium]
MGARRAAGDDALLAEFDLLEDEGDKISLSSLMKQAVTAVLVACLGIVVVGAVSATSAPYSTAVSSDEAAVSGAADVTRAVPIITIDDTTTVPAASIDATGTDDDISRSAVRSELSSAVAAQQESARTQAMSGNAQQVADAAQTAAADQRAAALSATSTLIATESQRIADAAARAAAEKKLGTLVSTSNKAVVIDASTLALLATIDKSATWVSPVAPGSYTRSAVFGEYGVWSRYHTGVDLTAPLGTPIVAAGPGVVVASDGGGWAGTHVVIMHADGSRTLYAHMTAKVVQPGTVVKAGQLIGYVGMTGRAFGYHLHFEYYPPTATVGDPYTAADPLPFMLKHGVRI